MVQGVWFMINGIWFMVLVELIKSTGVLLRPWQEQTNSRLPSSRRCYSSPCRSRVFFHADGGTTLVCVYVVIEYIQTCSTSNLQESFVPQDSLPPVSTSLACRSFPSSSLPSTSTSQVRSFVHVVHDFVSLVFASSSCCPHVPSWVSPSFWRTGDLVLRTGHRRGSVTGDTPFHVQSRGPGPRSWDLFPRPVY